MARKRDLVKESAIAKKRVILEPTVACFPGSSVGLSARQVNFFESLNQFVAQGGNPATFVRERVKREKIDAVATCPTCGLVLSSELEECAACWRTA